MNDLINWKHTKPRLPLIILGARQVGKTWLMKEFARTEFPNRHIYINFEESGSIGSLFAGDIDPVRILAQLGMAFKTEVSIGTLLVFDEIQAEPRALLALKYFAEKRPDQPIIASGSLLGITLRKDASFPVGKVTFLNMEPMSFEEYLTAEGEEMIRLHLYKHPSDPLLGPNHERLLDLLRQYYVVGGMPQAVSAFIERRNPEEVDRIQDDLLLAYERDIARHAGKVNTQKILAVWNSIAAQLAKENKKFVFGKISEGARAREYDDAIQWLVDAKMVRRVVRNTKPELPLRGFTDDRSFKLYHLDIGLLRRSSRLDSAAITMPNDLFSIYRGAFTEQYVFQTLASTRRIEAHHFWSNPSGTAEIDCVFQYANRIFPLEMKAGINTRARSLATYIDMFHPDFGIRTSMRPLSIGERIIDLPLYSLSMLSALMDQTLQSREGVRP